MMALHRNVVATAAGRSLRCTAGALVAAGLALAANGAAAQAPNPPVVGGELATPIEVEMLTVNGEVVCRPPAVRLPARTPIEFRAINCAERPIMIVTEHFFEIAEIIETSEFALQARPDGFLVPAEGLVRVLLQTPPAGEYAYSCFEPGALPTPKSSGFLIAVPAER
jgi:hypothetical protein